MATKKKVARPKTQGKAAKAAEYVRISRSELARCRALLVRAQREAVMAAPRRVPRTSWGAVAALDAFETIWIVDQILADAESAKVQP